jgi:hypothetical protein
MVVIHILAMPGMIAMMPRGIRTWSYIHSHLDVVSRSAISFASRFYRYQWGGVPLAKGRSILVQKVNPNQRRVHVFDTTSQTRALKGCQG